MLSSGARLGDHGDEVSRSMMGSQLERGNSSSSTREVRGARVHLPPAQLRGLETRDRSEAMHDTAGWMDQRARLTDTIIHTEYNYNQNRVHDGFISPCFSRIAPPNAASHMLKLAALANATKPGCKVSAGPADWLCRASAVRDTQP